MLNYSSKRGSLPKINVQNLLPFSESDCIKPAMIPERHSINFIKKDQKNFLLGQKYLNETYFTRDQNDHALTQEVSVDESIRNIMPNNRTISRNNISINSVQNSALGKPSLSRDIEYDLQPEVKQQFFDRVFQANSKNTIEYNTQFEKKAKASKNKESISCKSNFKLRDKDFKSYLNRNLNAFHSNVFSPDENLNQNKVAIDKFVKNNNIDKSSAHEYIEQSDSMVENKSLFSANNSSIYQAKSQFYLPVLHRNQSLKSANYLDYHRKYHIYTIFSKF